MEPQGEKSEELKVFEQMFLASCKTKRVSKTRGSAAKVRWKMVWGVGSMKNHGNKARYKIGQLVQQFSNCRYTSMVPVRASLL